MNKQLTKNFNYSFLIYLNRSLLDLKLLLQTYLYSRDEGVIEDSISRRICIIEFRDQQLEKFKSYCKDAKGIYEKEIIKSIDDKKWLIS